MKYAKKAKNKREKEKGTQHAYKRKVKSFETDERNAHFNGLVIIFLVDLDMLGEVY